MSLNVLEWVSNVYSAASELFLQIYSLGSGSYFPISLSVLVLIFILIDHFKFNLIDFDMPLKKIQIFDFLFISYTALAFAYVIFPNFHDHIESSVSILSDSLIKGGALYPDDQVWPYSMLVYGPYLFIFQSFILSTSMPIIEASKLIGFFSILISFFLVKKIFKNQNSYNVLALILPAGFILFWNRPEPLILCFTLYSLFLLSYLSSFFYRGILGASLGILVNLKFSMLPIALLILFFAHIIIKARSKQIFEIMFFMLIFLVAPFTLSAIDFTNYLNFIFYASTAGIDYWILATNFIFFALLMVYAMPSIKKLQLDRQSIIVVLSLLFAAFIPSVKTGGGIWHLLPIVIVSAYIIEHSKAKEETYKGKYLFYISCFFSVIFVIYFSSILINKQNYWNQAKYELSNIQKTYPNMVMGVTDLERYGETFYRVLLDNEQLDAPAFMELNFIGKQDNDFAEKLSNCDVQYLILPNTGDPFSINNFYTQRPLFSESTINEFDSMYKIIDKFTYYNVYQCKN